MTLFQSLDDRHPLTGQRALERGDVAEVLGVAVAQQQHRAQGRPRLVAHRDRRLAGVQRQIDIILSDRRVIAGELDKEIRTASGYRADGNLVPEEISARIDELDGMIRSLDQQMGRRAEEIEQINDEFAAKIERFKVIKPQQ